MADKGAAGKAGADKPMAVQPKDEVGTRKGCRRYRWEFKDSNKEFWFMGHAEVKILTLGCLVAAYMLFNTVKTHPVLTLIISMEVSVLIFFIILYTFAINRYMPFILWPVSDLLNDLFACIFLIGGIVLAVKKRRTLPLNYFIAMILMGVAALFAFIDLCLQRGHFKSKKAKKNVLVPPNKDGQLPQTATGPPTAAGEGKTAGKADKKKSIKGGGKAKGKK